MTATKAEREAKERAHEAHVAEVQAVVDRLETRRDDLKATLKQAIDEQKPSLEEQIDLNAEYLRLARAELAELTAK